jgi:hypothetical protein
MTPLLLRGPGPPSQCRKVTAPSNADKRVGVNRVAATVSPQPCRRNRVAATVLPQPCCRNRVAATTKGGQRKAALL